MKRTILRCFAAFLAVAMLLCLVGCGKDDGNQFSGSAAGGSGNQTTSEPIGQGFTANHAAEAGFGMGTDTLADITTRFGQPLSVDTNEYSSLTLVTAFYDCGVFEFEGTDGATPVLTYAEISSSFAGPHSLSFGSSIEQCADTVYAGSSSLFAGYPQQRIQLYGSEGVLPNGNYTFLTIEYTSSSTADTYALNYYAESYEPGRSITYTLYFDGAGKLIRYSLRYV